MHPASFLHGVAFEGTAKVPYPRARADDFVRLPVDTWSQAQIPVGVRLELEGEATMVDVTYRTTTDRLGPRGDGAGRAFSAWYRGEKVGEVAAELGEGVARVPLGTRRDAPVTVYLPEGMRPEILDVAPVDGTVFPAEPGPRWVAYGDSVVEGWIASEPALAWPSIAARAHRLNVVNMGYAGAARGEVVSAEHLAALEADVITISHGTNCWTRIPHSVGMMREGTRAFLEVVREGHPSTPILVVSPVVRPDAESTPNRLGATLADLRDAIERVVRERIDDGDTNLELLEGARLIAPDQLGDGLHPNDDGHRAIAAAVGPRVAALAGVRTA